MCVVSYAKYELSESDIPTHIVHNPPAQEDNPPAQEGIRRPDWRLIGSYTLLAVTGVALFKRLAEAGSSYAELGPESTLLEMGYFLRMSVEVVLEVSTVYSQIRALNGGSESTDYRYGYGGLRAPYRLGASLASRSVYLLYGNRTADDAMLTFCHGLIIGMKMGIADRQRRDT